jgi:hypothetical protein
VISKRRTDWPNGRHGHRWSTRLLERRWKPGVYMAREPGGSIVYVGRAAERAGGGKPKGLRGRLSVYVSGKGLASGLGEAVLDRALADADLAAKPPDRG